MGRIVVSETTSLDGVIQDPVGTDGFRFAGWFDRLGGQDKQAWAKVEFEEAMTSDAVLMGRATYEWFVERGWPTKDGAWADRLRALPKYVVTATRTDFDWDNTEPLHGEVVDEVAKLRQHVDGDVVVYGSGRLVHTLLAYDLVDELRVVLCPFVVGEGDRLFDQHCGQQHARLVSSNKVSDNLVQLVYRTGQAA